ncbi:hypothetical protein [Natrinema gelatinilyticum]|uniref:hypothetical protein n=1 Tax=Natrinema gelatinilyticum TaxID=2961571 RepID=UPI0020C465D4|nr:hypothetical protein [Natrinema gelatinilyticum]
MRAPVAERIELPVGPDDANLDAAHVDEFVVAVVELVGAFDPDEAAPAHRPNISGAFFLGQRRRLAVDPKPREHRYNPLAVFARDRTGDVTRVDLAQHPIAYAVRAVSDSE